MFNSYLYAMNITINLSEETKSMLLELAILRKNDLNEQSETLLKLIKETDDLIAQLNGQPSPKSLTITGINSSEYPRKSAWHMKIAYVIKEAGRFLTQNDIMVALNGHEKFEGTWPIKSVSGTLSTNSKPGEQFAFFVSEKGKYRYGLSEWLDNKGNPKSEFM